MSPPATTSLPWLGVLTAGGAALIAALTVAFWRGRSGGPGAGWLARRQFDVSRYANDMVVLADEDHRIVDVNDRATAMLGYSRRELLRMRIAQIRDPATVHDLESRREAQRREGQAIFETRLRRKDGGTFPVEASIRVFAVRGRVYHLGTLRDITERQRADAERSFRLMLLETLHDAVVGLDLDLRVRSWNKAAERLYGFTADEAIGKFVGDVSGTIYAGGQADRERTFAEVARCGHLSLPLQQRRRDGSRVDVEAEAIALRDGAGQLTGYLCVNRDVTERKRAEDALRESEAKFRAAFEGAGLGIALLDATGSIFECNRALRELLGYSEGELERTALVELVHPDDRSAARADSHGSGTSTGRVSGERRYRRKDGSYVHGLLRSNVVRDASGTFLYTVALIEDVTQKKAAEAQLLFADRMTSMGTLAAGVAHEINNPLAFVGGNIAYALEQLRRIPAVPAAVLEALEDSREGAARVRDIVRDLKMFSRPDETGQDGVDVHEVLRSALNLAHNELKHRARLVVALDDVPLVAGNPHRLGQVFLNLILNAAQAVEEGHADRNQIRIACRGTEDGRVVVTVSDTGCGIAPDVLPRIFEPFFTTKPVGVGTGLGLSICHGIVKALGGEIRVTSRPDEGSIFSVFLPAAAAPRTVAGEQPAAAAGDSRGRILVVDDDLMVGRAIARILGHDHEVAVLTNAADALALLGGDRSFDVILCDVMMPEMTGIELYQRLAETAPALRERVVFLTGGAFTERAQAFLGSVANDRVDKPFEAAILRSVVSRRIAAARPPSPALA
jgi:PAS domain S-box-containing protein